MRLFMPSHREQLRIKDFNHGSFRWCHYESLYPAGRLSGVVSARAVVLGRWLLARTKSNTKEFGPERAEMFIGFF